MIDDRRRPLCQSSYEGVTVLPHIQGREAPQEVLDSHYGSSNAAPAHSLQLSRACSALPRTFRGLSLERPAESDDTITSAVQHLTGRQRCSYSGLAEIIRSGSFDTEWQAFLRLPLQAYAILTCAPSIDDAE